MAQATRGVIKGKLVGVKTGISQWSTAVYTRLPVRPSGPAAPSGVSASAATESIILTWTAPTTNADGSVLKSGALKSFYVYWSQTPGIDITNPTTYSGRFKEYTERYTFTVPDPSTYLGPYYFVVTAVDSEGNQSAASTEVSATASAQIPGPSSVDDWSTGNIESVLVGKGRTFIKLRLPKSTWKNFAYYKIYYDVDTGAGYSGTWSYLSSERVGYPHAPLNEAYKYKYKVTVVGEDGTETAGTIDDNGGLGYTPNAADQGAILADTVAAGYIIAAYDMTARTFIGGALHSLNWGASVGTELSLDDEIIRLGGSGVGYNTGTGVWLGNDAGTYKLFIGNSAGNKVTWDGTTLAVTGALTAGSGSSIDGSYLVDLSIGTAKIADAAITNAKINDLSYSKITAGTSDASITIGSLGYIQSSNYVAGSTGFKINGAGNAEFNDVTVRGALITGSGSSINGGYLINGSVTYGKIGANAVRTNELYIDGDVNFGPSTYNNIYGVDVLYFGASGTASPMYIGRNAGSSNMLIHSGGIIQLYGTQTAIYGTGTAGVLLNSTGNIQLAFGSDYININSAQTSGGQWGYGYICVTVNGITRAIPLGSGTSC